MVSQQNLPLYPIRHQMMFGSVSDYCVNLQDAKRGKTCVLSLNALFRGTELAKMVSQQNQLFYPIRPRTMFESVSMHFANFQHFKQGKTCVSGQNALFQGTELVKLVSQRNQPFFQIRHQMIFDSVSEHFVNLQHVNRG